MSPTAYDSPSTPWDDHATSWDGTVTPTGPRDTRVRTITAEVLQPWAAVVGGQWEAEVGGQWSAAVQEARR